MNDEKDETIENLKQIVNEQQIKLGEMFSLLQDRDVKVINKKQQVIKLEEVEKVLHKSLDLQKNELKKKNEKLIKTATELESKIDIIEKMQNEQTRLNNLLQDITEQRNTLSN